MKVCSTGPESTPHNPTCASFDRSVHAHVLVIIWALVAVAGVSTPCQADLTDGLIAHYEFDGDASDSAGGHHGVEHGVSYVPGYIGMGVSFDGSSYVSVPATGWLTPLETFSIAAWIRVASFPSEQAYPFVHDRQNGDASPNKHFDLRLYQNTLYSGWESPSGTDASLQYDGFWSEFGSDWVHLAMTRDTVGAGRLYVNGVLADSVQGALETGNTDDLMFGAIRTTGTAGSESFFFDGDVDDARLYSRALSGEEVRALYLGVDDPASVESGAAPKSTVRLGRPYPNPTSASASFAVEVSIGQRVRVEVIDSSGRLVREVFAGPLDPGRHSFHWTADGDLPSGTYYVRLRSGNSEEGRPVILLR